MRRLLAVVSVVALLAAGCGGDDSEEQVEVAPNDEQSLRLSVRHTQPLRARSPVTWTLEVRNGGANPITLAFSSAQKGDVALYQGLEERYRWSTGKDFTEAFSETSLAPGQAEVIELRDGTLNVPAGQYELVAVLNSGPAPGELRQPVTVTG